MANDACLPTDTVVTGFLHRAVVGGGEERRVRFVAMRSPRATTAREPGLSPRASVDYALARRAVLTALAGGRMRRTDVCDATVYLRRAARYHGEPAGIDCPLCEDPLLHVTYTYGDSFRPGLNGRARPTRDLPELAREYSEFRVYVVEVCLGCGWNHLVTSYLLGTGEPAPVQRRSRARTGR